MLCVWRQVRKKRRRTYGLQKLEDRREKLEAMEIQKEKEGRKELVGAVLKYGIKARASREVNDKQIKKVIVICSRQKNQQVAVHSRSSVFLTEYYIIKI